MKKLHYTFFAVIFLLSCKYEEGPAVSFRSKRDRLCNTWHVTNYETNGTANDQILKMFSVGDSIQMSFTIMRGGRYCTDVQYTQDYKEKMKLESTKYIGESNNFKWGNSEFMQKILFGGMWSFQDRHKNLELKPYDLSHFDEVDAPLKADIVKLKQNELKLKFTLSNNVEHVITFKTDQ